jgi:two-component system, chemotaxis family, sensor kinase CheA
MKLRTRLLLGFASIICLIAVFSLIVNNMMSAIRDNMVLIAEDRYAKVSLANDVRRDVLDISRALNGMFLFTDRRSLLSSIEDNRRSASANLAELKTYNDHATGTRLLSRVDSSLTGYSVELQTVLDMLRQERIEDAKVHILNILDLYSEHLTAAIDEYNTYQEQAMEQAVEEANRTFHTIQTILWGSAAVVLILSILTALNVIRSIIARIRLISGVMESLNVEGTSDLPRIDTGIQDEINEIALSYNRMADELEERNQRELQYTMALQDQNWLKTSVAQITNLYHGQRDLATVARRVLSHAAPLVGAAYGAFYYRDEPHGGGSVLRCLSTFADGAEAVLNRSFRLGEGLVGQCALEGKMMELEPPAGYIRIASGLGETEPCRLLLLPVPYDHKATAVIELAFFGKLTSVQRSFLEEIRTGSLGVALHNIANHMRIQQLLQESQQYAEELQSQSEEMHQQQEELRSLNERLEEQFHSSEQKGMELEQIRLELEAKARELQASSEYKSEFLANMSHELRTPLNSLLILSQMLADNQENNLTPKQVEYIHTIMLSGNELLALINDILDLSKIEAGQMDFYEEEINLREIADDLLRQFQAIAQRKQLSFHIDFDPELEGVLLATDQQRLQQIIRNLLSNAFKFTSQGGVTLAIRSAAMNGAPGIVFSVKDTGIGIPLDKQREIFEAFNQVDGSISRKYGGTGLGLSISRHLAALLGGEIGMESEVGKGSDFRLWVPMHCERQAAIAEAAPAAEAGSLATGAIHTTEEAGLEEAGASKPSGDDGLGESAEYSSDSWPRASKGKILIVDDDIRNVYALSTALTEHRYQVVFAENGKLALAKLAEHPDVDLVLMDIMMPEMSGYEAIRAIRKLPGHRSLPIVALTAKAMKNDRELCLEAGADDYISKPVKLDKLLSLVSVWLHGRKSVE